MRVATYIVVFVLFAQAINSHYVEHIDGETIQIEAFTNQAKTL